MHRLILFPGILCLYFCLDSFQPYNCIDHLIFKNGDSSISSQYILDSIDFFFINEKLASATLDSICEARKFEDSVTIEKLALNRSGKISDKEYSDFVYEVFDHRDINLGIHGMWFTGYDTIMYDGKIYDLFRFDISYAEEFSQHYCYTIVYAKNLFITTFGEPVPNHFDPVHTIYSLDCHPIIKDDSLLIEFKRRSTDVFYGSEYFLRKYNIK